MRQRVVLFNTPAPPRIAIKPLLAPIFTFEISDGAALTACIAPFGEWTRQHGGREFRDIRTTRYTYVRDLSGIWSLELLWSLELGTWIFHPAVDAELRSSRNADFPKIQNSPLRHLSSH
jgi:hypothetical protein